MLGSTTSYKQHTFLQKNTNAEGMGLYIAVPDFLLGFSVPLLVGGIPLEPVVDSVFELTML